VQRGKDGHITLGGSADFFNNPMGGSLGRTSSLGAPLCEAAGRAAPAGRARLGQVAVRVEASQQFTLPHPRALRRQRQAGGVTWRRPRRAAAAAGGQQRRAAALWQCQVDLVGGLLQR
jgi:hypothetical protein